MRRLFDRKDVLSRSSSTSSSPPPPPYDDVQPMSISHLRDALDALDSQMAALITHRQQLQSHLEQAVRSQSPIYRLPQELLSSIFIAGVCQSGDQDPLLVSNLMLVCRYWRDVVVTSPELWANICIGPHDSLQKARCKLARSKSVPIDITVDIPPRTDSSSNAMENVIRAMDLIRPALWRARSFRLNVSNRPQAHAALVRCKEDAPLLESLSISILHSMQEDHYSSRCLPLFNGHTPRLHSCSFISFNFGWEGAVVSRLRVLQLGGYWNGFAPSADKLLEMLRACPLLEELTIRNMSDIDPAHPEPDKIVKLPRLVKASFHYAGNLRIRMLFSHMSFPALESLEFCYLDNLTPVLEFLRQQSLTSLPLRYMRIESSFFDEAKLVTLLKRLTSITTLKLVDAEDASTFLLKNLSTPPSSHPWICPKLEHLNLNGCTNLDWDALRGLVESRLSGMSVPVSSTCTTGMRVLSTASASAHVHALVAGRCASPLPAHRRLTSIDVTHCPQITKEMVQWLRMYVRDVCCESGWEGNPLS